jgi:ABC-type bacteriocin/lantibiotic exporter with double-glycine peptidase domain
MSLLPVLHRRQQRQADCLAACAAMILDYFQVPIDYRDLVKRRRIESYGAPFTNLRYLESSSIQVQIQGGTIDSVREYLERGIPPIAFVNTEQLGYWNESTSHAVVVVGIEDNQIYVDDPAFADAPMAIPTDEFILGWIDLDQFFAVIHPK